ncbi:MAG: hypothetical protein RL154_6, partial [Pseudomonadota bacterium]
MQPLNIKDTFRILKNGKISMVLAAMLSSASITSVASITTLTSIASITIPTNANAAPTGGSIVAGTATITKSGSTNNITTNINQTTNKAIINWNNFSIGKAEVVNFNVPNKNSVSLNRVIGNEKSVIDGMLNSNGQVFLVNPNGVLISKSGAINTSGLLVTTKSITDDNFMNSNYKFTTNEQSKSSSVINMGTINISNSGYAALIANQVTNQGSITAIKGQVRLVGADEYSINLNGNSLVSLTVSKSVVDALVDNSGAIIADGGEIYLTANAADSLLNSVVNNSGIVQARTVDDLSGKIELFANGGTANVSGTLDASAPISGNGGFIETSGKVVNVVDNTTITTKALNGKSGTWLIDPTDFTIAASGGNMTGATLGTNLGSGSVTIQSSSGSSGTNGDIFVNDIVSWSANNTLTLNAYRNIYVNSSVTSSGASGKVVLLYGQGAVNSGNTATYNINAPINLQAGQNFSTTLGSNGSTANYTVITALGTESSSNNGTLQGIQGALTGNFVLGANIDASGTSTWNTNTGWTPIGSSSSSYFSGTFDGLGHSVSGLTINRPTTDNIGLFGYFNTSTASLSNIGLTNVSITGQDNVGGLVGYATGNIINSYATGTINARSYAGGLIGQQATGSIESSHASVAVTVNSDSSGGYIGGLVGTTAGAAITNSYATGNVSFTTTLSKLSYMGGLAGRKSGT